MFTANDGFLIVYDDNVDSYLASVHIGTQTADNGLFASADLTVDNLVKLSGVADATTVTAANFLAFTA